MLLVVGGMGGIHGNTYLNSAELLNVDGIQYQCDDPDPYPLKAIGSFGGIVNNELIVCGGRNHAGDYLRTCYRLDSNSGRWKEFPRMLQDRGASSYAQIPNGKVAAKILCFESKII